MAYSYSTLYIALFCFPFAGIRATFSESPTCVNTSGLPSVETKQGTVLGTYFTSRNGTTFEGFLGLKFAEGAGKYRFESPGKYTERFLCKDASKPAPVCLQWYDSDITGKEDCLTLNVYRPKLESNFSEEKLPVIIYFVPGIFQIELNNPNDLGPEYIMDEKLIFVVPNYRVGWFGLISHEDDILPGNYALKDQVAAMKWVRQNIDRFGGDPNKVTIWGYSSGAISITLHLITPVSQGLFNQAIIESGNILDFSALSHPGQVRDISLEFISSVGCYRNDSKSIKECLKQLPASKLVIDKQSLDKLLRKYPPATRLLVIEPKHKDAYLTEDPYTLLRKRNYAKVPIAVGMTSQEGALISDPLFTYNRSYIDWCLAEYKKCFPNEFGYKYTADNKDGVSEKVHRHYFSNETRRNVSLFQLFTDAYTERRFWQPMINYVKLYKGWPVYMYYQKYKNNFTYSSEYGDQIVKGPTHRDQMIDQFPSEDRPPLSGRDVRVSEKAIIRIGNFAIYKNPNGIGYSQPWKPVSTDNFETQVILQNGSTVMSKNIRKSGYELWQYSGIREGY